MSDSQPFPHHIIMDIETLRFADDCRHCGCPKDEWETSLAHPSCSSDEGHETIGWSNRPALGLSIGCAWDSRDGRTHFFDEMNLQETMQRWVDDQPLIVGFNSAAFDLTLLRGILRRRAETLWVQSEALDDYPEGLALERQSKALTALCDAFKLLCATSYDVLVEVWKADPASKRVKGLNGLGSIAAANGYGGKTGNGADAPRLWAAGKYAEVRNYCAWDVELTRKLFEQVLEGKPIKRSDGSSLVLPKPSLF